MSDSPIRPGKLHFVQALRVFLILLVIAHHAGQPYGPTGGAWPVEDPVSSDALLPFFAINAAFFMGFFFLISGYFLEASFERKGAWPFLRSRLVRLGIPILVLVYCVNGVTSFASSGSQVDFWTFYVRDYLGGGQVEFGPMWFVAHLLVYALIYAIWRLAGGRGPDPAVVRAPPGHRLVLAYTLGLAIVTFLLRQVFPQDQWVVVLWLVPLEPAHLPQYASLFVIGIIAGRGHWFTTIRTAVAVRSFAIGIGLFLVLTVMSSPDLELPGFLDPRRLWGFVESFVAVGMILGLLVLFRRFASGAGRGLTRLAGDAYGAYLVHVYVVVGLQIWLLGIDLPALGKFGVVTCGAALLSFLIADALRRLPGFRAVL